MQTSVWHVILVDKESCDADLTHNVKSHIDIEKEEATGGVYGQALRARLQGPIGRLKFREIRMSIYSITSVEIFRQRQGIRNAGRESSS